MGTSTAPSCFVRAQPLEHCISYSQPPTDLAPGVTMLSLRVGLPGEFQRPSSAVSDVPLGGAGWAAASSGSLK